MIGGWKKRLRDVHYVPWISDRLWRKIWNDSVSSCNRVRLLVLKKAYYGEVLLSLWQTSNKFAPWVRKVYFLTRRTYWIGKWMKFEINNRPMNFSVIRLLTNSTSQVLNISPNPMISYHLLLNRHRSYGVEYEWQLKVPEPHLEFSHARRNQPTKLVWCLRSGMSCT